MDLHLCERKVHRVNWIITHALGMKNLYLQISSVENSSNYLGIDKTIHVYFSYDLFNKSCDLFK